MNKFVGLVVVVSMFCVVGCESMLVNKPTIPVGEKLCRSDFDCSDISANSVCLFKHVDSYATCSNGNNDMDEVK
jgi:hypothetical protein